MSKNYRGKSPAYHNISNAKFCPMTEEGVPGENIIGLKYSKSIALSARLERQDVFADGRNVLAIPSDQGYEGSYGTTDQDIDFETAIGLAEEFANGLATVKLNGYRRGYLYYEFKRTLPTGQDYVVKVWMYEVEIGKPDINHETDTTTLTLGSYTYPLRVYGTPALDDVGKPVTDNLGNQKVVMMMRSLPGDPDYETFGDAVQVPKRMAEAPPEDPETPEV